MTIRKIGAQGQEFVGSAVERIAEAKALFPRAVISVDGGINETTIVDVVRAGATRICVGAAFSSVPDAQGAYTKLKNLTESAVQ
jgi:pentose-5-phosphate-3-epimerase